MTGQFAENQRSMEEILSSIRETIEEDIRGGRRWAETALGPAIASLHPDGAPQAPTGKVIELTQLLNEDGSVTSLEPQEMTYAPSAPAQGAPILTLVQEVPAQEAQEEAYAQETAIGAGEAPSAALSPSTPQQEVTPMTDTNAAQQAVEDIFDAAPAPEAAPVEASAKDIDAMFASAPAPAAQEEVAAPQPVQEEKASAQDIDDMFAAAPTPAAAVEETFAPQSSQEIAQAVDLISQETLAASSDALAALTDRFASAPSMTSGETGIGSKTVEALMQDMLRPMLKDWLDAHLPSLVKWIVTEQIEKVVQQRFGNHKG
ncbi:MAG: DUF2497 domain-containing protein [Proteobacteria bacterium]|nr:DUF2497 domain-containing protein [Pseudomonadota bacterium]